MHYPRKGKGLLVTFAVATLFLFGCADDGDDGADGIDGGISVEAAESLDIAIDAVEINSAPVVTFTATDDSGVPIAGLSTRQVRFNIAKLVPGTNGDPNAWQNYINNLRGGELQGTSERVAENLEALGGGQYRYTFDTDITNPDEVTCADGLDCSYEPTLTHRVAIQVSGFPALNPIFDFRPSDGTVLGVGQSGREIVKTETCNSCHNQLAMHGGGRVETQYCVTCHNPGSTDPDTDNTVDMKVLIHKLHRGAGLPSVIGGTPYQIIGYNNSVHDYSTVVFPQDIRNCTKCHTEDDTETPQASNWRLQPSIEACGSCHDDVYFGLAPETPIQTVQHPGGDVDNSICLTCHLENRIAGSVEDSHALVVNDLVTRFQFNILEICGNIVDDDADGAPNCAGAPTVKFSVTDPSNGDATYDVVNDPEFGSGASLNILTAWDSSDYNNAGGSGSRPARANSFSLSNIKATATDNLDGTFTVTLAALPVTSGSGGIAIEGHPLGRSDPDATPPSGYDTEVPVEGAVAYFGINGSPLVERRVAVDIVDKCDACHSLLSMHGNNRAENAQLCVMCHNPRNTDVSRRPKDGAGAPDPTATADGKSEETIDMKVMVHAIHAGEAGDHGIRDEGIVIYGYGGREHDYGHVRFPGILTDCTRCHNSGTYELDGDWAAPLQNGIQATTVRAAPTATDTATLTTQVADQTDDLYTTPTAAVCSACHTGDVDKAHMEQLGGAVFEANAAAIAASFETCSVCHGPGSIADVSVVHGVD